MNKKYLLFFFFAAVVLLILFQPVLNGFQLYQLSKLKGDKSKLWVHRVNSALRLEYLIDDFAGFEMDLVYSEENNKIAIHHPPGYSSQYFLEDAFRLSGAANKKWWLDIKEDRDIYFDSFIAELSAVRQASFAETDVIVETANVRLIGMLKAKGFTTAFNLSAGKKDIQQDSAMTFIGSNADYISFDEQDKGVAMEKFSGKKKLMWALSFNKWTSSQKLQELVSDTSVSVVLVNVKSPGYK